MTEQDKSGKESWLKREESIRSGDSVKWSLRYIWKQCTMYLVGEILYKPTEINYIKDLKKYIHF